MAISPLFYGLFAGQNQTGPGQGLSYAQAQEQLKTLQKYDPNASLQDTGQQGDVGTGMGRLNPDGTMNYDTYTLNYDRSKLPAPAAGTTALGDRLVNFDPTDPTFNNQSAYGGHQWIKDPTKVFNDPNYGWVTPPSNYGTEYTGTKQDKTNDMIGKVIEMAALSVMGGGAAAALGGGTAGMLGSGAMQFAGNEVLSGGKADPVSAIISMLTKGGMGSVGGLQGLLQMLQGGG